jgi:hypothetical protein
MGRIEMLAGGDESSGWLIVLLVIYHLNYG